MAALLLPVPCHKLWQIVLIRVQRAFMKSSCLFVLIITLGLLSKQQVRAALTQNGKKIVQIGVILPVRQDHFPWSMRKVKPGISIAVDHVNEDKNVLPDHFLKMNTYDSDCSDIYGPLYAIDMYLNKKANVFLGPACDYSIAPIARLSPFWDIPMITAGALVQAFTDKKTYSLLTRIQGTYDKLGRSLAYIYTRFFNWYRPCLVYTTIKSSAMRSPCHFIMEAVYTSTRVPLRHVHPTEDIWYTSFEEREGSDEFFSNLLQEKVSKNCRIVLLCASADSIRQIMLKAHELGYTNGEYAFFNIDLFSSKLENERPWYRADDPEERNQRARQAYESLMMVTLRKPESKEYERFSRKVKERALIEYGNFSYEQDEVNSFVGAFHDAVILYSLALNKTLAEGGSEINGSMITKNMWNRTFPGITGMVHIDENGDRNADYSILDMNPSTGKFHVIANYYGSIKRYEELRNRKIHWAGGLQGPPPDKPKCGYDGSGCPPEEPFPLFAIVIIVLGLLLITVLLAAFFIYRHYKLEAELAEVNWRVRWDDIMFGALEKRKLERSGSCSRVSLAKRHSLQSVSGDSITVQLTDIGSKQIYTKTGYYKSALIAIKKIAKTNITITKPLLMDFKKMRDLQNDHLVRFIGICIDPPNQCILTEYCQKGSLQDVLENEQIKLDWMFKYSLMQDIVRGMAYLCSSDIKSHGNLKSSNCVVDSRFVLKITDFGLHHLRYPAGSREENNYVYYKGKLWTAPELLRLPNPPPEGTQKGDVYSFAIISQEIVYRNGPFWVKNMDLLPDDIYRKVKNGQRPYFRPTLDQLDEEDSSELSNMIKKCWSEDPLERPDFHALKTIIRKINKDGDSGNILDNLLSRMEQYANNLEALVEERTADYLEQKKRAEDLLYMMLPKSVACQLMRGESVTAERFDQVTIYFSDICGFTALSSQSTPEQVIDLLNDLYTTFDGIIDTFDVYKVETIGDAYMVVSGLPSRNGNLHAREIARMSIALLNATLSFKIRHRPHDQLRLRIGVHTGSVVAGVVGLKMPRYCLFGDTVNTASRMESNGLPLRIHLSPDTKKVLDQFGTFQVELRGAVEMKGKGKITTYWLLGEENHYHPDWAAKTTSV